MTEPQSSWAFVGISPEARQAAELAAEAAGMELDVWLAQLIKYKSTMELKGREAVPLDTAIMQIAAPGNGAAAHAVPAAAAEAEPETAPKALPEATEAETPEPAASPAEVAAEAPPGAAEVEVEAEADAAVPPAAAEVEAEVDVEVEAEAEAEASPSEADVEAETEAEASPAEAEVEAEAVAEVEGETEAEASPAEAEVEDEVEAEAPPATAEAPPSAPNDNVAPAPPVAAAPEPTPNPVPEPAPAAAPLEAPPEPSPRKSLPTEALRPSRLSALSQANEEAIQGAFDAWRDSRTLEPLLVRPSADERNMFEVIVGIERWHAARRAHIRELPAIVHHASDEEAIRLAMSARLKRGPLSPLTEARIYLSLMSEAGMSTEQVARMVGKPPAHVATMVRVINLPRSVRDMLERGELTALHARALLDAPNAEALAREVIARRLDIYQAEQLVRIANLKAERAEKVDLDAVDLDLSEGGYQEPDAAPAVLDGDNGFGPETRFDRESFAAPSAEAPGFDDVDGALTFDDVDDEALDLIEAEAPADEAAEAEADEGAEAETPETAIPAAARPAAETAEDTAAKPAQQPESTKPPPLPEPKKDVVTTELLEHHLSHLLGLKVAISEWHNMGVISIHYTSREELSDVVSRLNSGSPG